MEKKKKKKIILAAIAVILVILLIYVGYMCIHYFFYNDYRDCVSTYDYEKGTEYSPLSDSDVNVEGMELVAENDNLKLYTNTKTTEIAVYDKRTKEITYSNPLKRDNDPLANGVNKSMLSSQLIIDYYNSTRTTVTINNYDLSIKSGQYKIESIPDGIRYIYTIGDLSSPTGIVPIYITEDRLKTLVLDKVTEKEAKTIKSKYAESETIDGFLELTKGAQRSKVGLKKLSDIFEKAGYTEDNYLEDKEASLGTEAAETITFVVELEYRLVDNELVVSVPTNRIKENGSGKIATIELLPYFGAAGTDEEGYMMVPNGSGSIINFNNGKTTAPSYNQYVYGVDPVMQSYIVVENTENARLPVFGIKRENSAIFAEITGGDTLANIIADVAGKQNSYNFVSPTFTLRSAEILSMFGISGGDSNLPVVETNFTKVNIKVNYSFLEKEEASYSGMANYYRNELIKNGTLEVNKESDSIPFYVDILGGVKKETFVAGVPKKKVYPLTTFDEASKIADALYESDISNLRMNFQGWFNGGYYHDVADKITGLSKLGGKKAFENLSEKLENNGGKLFADVAFQKVTYISKRFNYKMEAARYFSGMAVNYGIVNPTHLRQTSGLGYDENYYDVISPKFLVRYVDKFSDKIKDYDITGISLRDLANYLTSDKKRTNVISREAAKDVVKAQFKKLEDTGKDIMINGGDFYGLSYADDIENIPTSQNSFYIVDQEIPFYEMVIHGCVDYTGNTINLSDTYDKNDIVLRLLEYGASPHFLFSYKESSDIKYTALASKYATKYDNWLSDAKSIYQEVNQTLKAVTNSSIIDHEILQPGVKKVTYDNGVIIYINTNETSVNVDGLEIPAKGYLTKGVEK